MSSIPVPESEAQPEQSPSAILHAVILAAGRGMRMMPLTAALPKPMAPYKDSTLIAQGIAKLKLKIPNIHVTVGYKGAMLAQHVLEHGASSCHNTEGQSNSWWLYNTLLAKLNEPVCVLTCDNIVDLDIERIFTDFVALGSPACMLVPVKPIPGLEGDFIFHEGQSVRRLSREDSSDIYCSGIQVLNPVRIAQVADEGADFYSLWNQLITADELKVSRVYPSAWISVDTLDQLAAVQSAESS